MKHINAITNIFGTVGGVPQVLLGISYIQAGQIAEGVAKISEGVSIFIVAYFIGK